MPVDLEISPNGDLVFSGGRDLSVVKASDLLHQRMMLRLRLVKGSYRLNKDLGSELYRLLKNTNTAAGRAQAASLVTQALRPIREISIKAIDVLPDENNERLVRITIAGDVILSRGGAAVASSPFVEEIPVPIVAASPSQTTTRA